VHRREFQLLGKDTQKAREAKDDLTQEGTARMLQLVDRKHLDDLTDLGCSIIC